MAHRLPILLLFAGIARADLSWTFAQDDSRPGGQGGIYAYSYPEDSARHSAVHQAKLHRVGTAPASAARLDFVLDGKAYPSAGFGLMFSETQPLDLRNLSGVRLHLSSDRPRRVRISFAARIPAYQAAFDTGVSFGRDIRAVPAGVTAAFGPGELSWPQWATDADIPASVTDADILASTWAIQFNISCEDSTGTCSRDTGWIRLDSLRLQGVGIDWKAPSDGDCTGDSIALSRFGQAVPKRNGLGGWWYAYTDASSSDSAARGSSRVLSAPDTLLASSWRPDSALGEASLAFHLVREGSYSGYADLETQMGTPDDQGRPLPTDHPGLKAISFELSFDTLFPSSLGGVTLHAKKAGKAYSGGKDHQIRIPAQQPARRWCIDLDSLQQPNWTSWVPFSPDSLLSLSWEVKLQENATEAIGGFSLRDVRLWFKSLAVRRTASPAAWAVRRSGAAVDVIAPANSGAARIDLVDARGRLLSSAQLDPATGSARIPAPPAAGMLWIRVASASGYHSMAVPPVAPR